MQPGTSTRPARPGPAVIAVEVQAAANEACDIREGPRFARGTRLLLSSERRDQADLVRVRRGDRLALPFGGFSVTARIALFADIFFVAGFARGSVVGLRLLLLLRLPLLDRGGGALGRRIICHVGLCVAFGLLGQPAIGMSHMLPLGADTRIDVVPGFGVALRRQAPITVCGSHSRLPPCHMT